jgi:glucose-1-phosphate thymidylyltransferase
MITKGIILAGGRATRLYPATMVIGKPLLPIFDKPMIYYPLSLCMQAQIRDICIVTSPHDANLFKELLGNGESWGIQISYRIQEEPKGIADVFFVAQDFIDGKACCLVLGDNLFIGDGLINSLRHIQAQGLQGAQVFAYPVSEPERFGVLLLDDVGQIVQILEKPNPAPSNLAVTGLYFFDEQATTKAFELKPSARGELEITDLNRMYLEAQQLHYSLLDPRQMQWFDTGTHDTMQQAIDYVSHYIHQHQRQVGCLEEIAFLNHWIDQMQLEKMAYRLRHTMYGQYLEQYFLKPKTPLELLKS